MLTSETAASTARNL